ncbi:MAG: alpha/beta hydrolase [Myxococcales bacterium]|nr:alpha/beta hydrolase [Myxococcales bacterium]MDD9970915.1 alpha/beta hydrolase [Myxococcales bacterium]
MEVSSEQGGERFVFDGARAPDRRRDVDAHGVRLAVYEWGPADGQPLILAHGGFDFARTFDVFAPLLAEGGFRVVSWDHRGHGDSAHAELYSWMADERDLLAVVDSTTARPCAVVGHSKGGSMLAHIIQALPHRFSRFAAIDGLPFRKPPPDVAERARVTTMAKEVSSWLEHRRVAATLVRKPADTPEQLATRRARMNPRLSSDWLRYLVGQGARKDDDGWRWKIDPSLRMGGFGPWRSRWATDRLPGFPIPLLGIFGTENEPMGWGVDPEELRPYLPAHARVEVLEDTGHFIHIERPQRTAELVLEFLQS